MAQEAATPELTLIGTNVRRLRRARALTQQQLAEAADFSVTTISGVERGVMALSVASLARLARALGVDLVDLLLRDLDGGAEGFQDELHTLVDALKGRRKMSEVRVLADVLRALRSHVDGA